MYTNDMTVITDYIAQQTEAVQPLLKHIYDLVHEEVSETVDGWKYGISTLLYKEIAPYVTGGGTLSFPTRTPIPDTLVQNIARVRKAYIEEHLKK